MWLAAPFPSQQGGAVRSELEELLEKVKDYAYRGVFEKKAAEARKRKAPIWAPAPTG